MAQKPQYIDVRKTYIFGDADAYPEVLVSTKKEDTEELTLPVSPYEGYNFLATSYGYISYFGTTSRHNFPPLTSRIQQILSYQLPTLEIRFIALCEDGIWVTNSSSIWVKLINKTFDSAIYKLWTVVDIENTFYFYLEGDSLVYKTGLDITVNLEITSFAPSFLNMSGQVGIFKAGTRLGFWDSLNSISWSSNFDFSNFTPSLETLAGNMMLGELKGDIVTIKNHGEAFIVYGSKSIIGVTLELSGNSLWSGHSILSDSGITHPNSVCLGASDHEHYVYATTAFYRLGKYSNAQGTNDIEVIFEGLADFLKEDRNVLMLTMIHKRYLFISEVSSRYTTADYTPTIIDPSSNTQLPVTGSSNRYTLYSGALIWDIQLSKWGKYKGDHSLVVDYALTNIPTYSLYNYTDLGMTAGIMNSGYLRIFDDAPVDSYITYGKIGFYRLGMMHLLEARVDFRSFCDGSITIESSLDGRSIEPSVTTTTNFTSLNTIVVYPNIRYKWYNIKVAGRYSIQYMEVRANISCRR